MITRCLILSLFVCLCPGILTVSGQTTIAFQGFEGTPADNWGYIPPVQNNTGPVVTVGAGNYGAAYALSGTQSMRVGGGSTTCGSGSSNCLNGSGSGGSCNNNPNGKVVEFNPIDISCYTNVTVTVPYRTHIACGGGGTGIDNGESITLETSLNGGAWNVTSSILGNNDCVWTYATNPVTCGSNPPAANPFLYNVPAGTTTVAIRVRIVCNRSDEVFYLDNVTLKGTPASALPPLSIQHVNP